VKGKADVAVIAAAAVTEIRMFTGAWVHASGLAVFTPAVGTRMALSKSKKHFVGLTWDDCGNKGGLAFGSGLFPPTRRFGGQSLLG
jgi:hypothetical protein